MPDNVLIRPYREADRDTIRQICCDTANCGRPIETFFHDRELVADLVISYYTDFEPSSLWVADDQGRAVGYLTGCLNYYKYNFIMSCWIMPMAITKAIFCGVLFHFDTWRLLRAAFKTFRLGGFDKKIPLKKYPVHLHIDIVEEFRGCHIGQKLMERFFEQLKATHWTGIYAVVRGDNTAGRKFFERMGFSILSQHPMCLPGEKRDPMGFTVVYGKQELV